MKLCNDTINVFNARVDPESGGNVWLPTQITGASWFLTDASAVDTAKGGLVAANRATIRIPEGADAGGKVYADPKTYASAEDVSGLWTLQAGDVIVKGSVPTQGNREQGTGNRGDGETTEPDEPGTSETLAGTWTPAKLKKAYGDCVSVLGVTDNRRAPRAKHFRVVGT